MAKIAVRIKRIAVYKSLQLVLTQPRSQALEKSESAQKIGGSAWYTPFALARLPRFFWGTQKLLYSSLCSTIIYHWITRVVIRNGGEFRERSCVQPSCIGCPWYGRKARNRAEGRTNAGNPSSFITVPSQTTWGIFQLTLNSEQPTSVSCIHFGKAETAQQSCALPTMFYTCASCIFTEYFSVLLSASSAYVSQ